MKKQTQRGRRLQYRRRHPDGAAPWRRFVAYVAHPRLLRLSPSDPNYPYAIRHERFPDWFPGDAGRVKLKMAWIVVDHNGKSFHVSTPPCGRCNSGSRDPALAAQPGLDDM